MVRRFAYLPAQIATFVVICIAISVFFPLLTHAQPASESETLRIYGVYVNRGVNSITIEWKTDPETKGKLEYADSTGVWQKTPWQDSYNLDHLMTVLNLKPNTTYLYRINAETPSGYLETERGTFNTLDEKILGGSQFNTSPNTSSSFQSLLSPIPTLVPAYGQNPGYPPTTNGQQPYFPAYIQNIYPSMPGSVLAAVAPTATPIPTPTPTPTPTPLAAFFTNNSIYLLFGVSLGLTSAFGVHYLTTRKSQGNPNQKKLGKREATMNKFRFSINSEEADESVL